MTQPTISLENVGPENYVDKTNFRRSKDQEIRREGWVKFNPYSGGAANQYLFDGSLTLVRLAELVRPNGDRRIVGASTTTIKEFDTGTQTWTTIGSGFSVLGLRWQAETINGYLILNNGIDLPVSYRVGDAAVTPCYEMREVGIASVGRIAEYNGFLFLCDVTEIDSNQLNPWMNGYSSFTVGSTVTENANFNIASGDTTKQFNVTTGAGTIVATLPAVQASPSWYVWLKKVDAGAGTVVTSPVLGDQKIVLANQNDMALIWSDGFAFYAKVFPLGVIPATAPYGIPPTDIVNRFPYEIAWSSFGQPTMWAPVYSVYMTSASATLNLPFPSQVFVANQTYVAVLGGGVNGGTLGGQSGTPNGVLVTAVSGKQITLAQSTDAGINYPTWVKVLRWNDIGSIVGKYQVQGDGSQIIGAQKIQNRLVLYRKTGIYTVRYTASVTNPFVVTPVYQGFMVPLWGDAIGTVTNENGSFHIYPGASGVPGTAGRFYSFDGVSTSPVIHKPCDDARDIFFSGLSTTDSVWCIDHPITKEIWFCRPGRVFAFDYEFNTPSKIDAQIDAAVACQKPGAQDRWFILGIGTNVYNYGITNDPSPVTTWLRDGVVPSASITYGFGSLGNQMNEKDLLNYTPLLSSPSADAAVSVQIYSTYNPSVAPVALMSPAAALPDPAGNNFIPCLFRAIYFQDQITVTDTRDIDVRISARLFEFDLIDSGGVTRTNN